MAGLGQRLLERAGGGGERAGGLGRRARLVMPGELPEPVLGADEGGRVEIAGKEGGDGAEIEEGAEIAVLRLRRRGEAVERRDRAGAVVRMEDQRLAHGDQGAGERIVEFNLRQAEADGLAHPLEAGAVAGMEPGDDLEPGPGAGAEIDQRGAAFVTGIGAAERDRHPERRRLGPGGEAQHGGKPAHAVGVVDVPGKARVGAAGIGARRRGEAHRGRRGGDHREVPGAERHGAAAQAEAAGCCDRRPGAVARRAEGLERHGPAGEDEARDAVAAGEADRKPRARGHGEAAAGGAEEDRREVGVGGRRDPAGELGGRRRGAGGDFGHEGRREPVERIGSGDAGAGDQSDDQAHPQGAGVAGGEVGVGKADADAGEARCHARAVRLPEQAGGGAGDGGAIGDGGERAVGEAVRELEPAVGGGAGGKGEPGEAPRGEQEGAGGEEGEQDEVRPGRQQRHQAEERSGGEEADEPERRPEQRPQALEAEHEPGGAPLPLEPGRPVRRLPHQALLRHALAAEISRKIGGEMR